jgi:hypothetical protein
LSHYKYLKADQREAGNLFGFVDLYFSLLVTFLRWLVRQFEFSKVLMSIHLLVFNSLEDKVAQYFN